MRVDPSAGWLHGWRLGLAAAGMFLSPVVLAIAGAMCMGGSHGARLLGALVGLGVGMVCSVMAARSLGRRDTESSSAR